MNLVFTGFMGSGKSVVGRAVAAKLGRKFYDTDILVETSAALCINEIFEKYGEQVFRQMESRAIERVSAEKSAVISCGGGAVLNLKNVENLKKNSIMIRLYAKAETIFERIKNDASRPLLKRADPLKEIKRLLNEREEFYARCDFSFDTSFLNAQAVADSILKCAEIKKILDENV
ncbi:MAG: shikimate kinase [Endomicrobium sp.]|jgi:shikimate kinase|nr:shikimate kinase [Endomicrobium sp.]